MAAISIYGKNLFKASSPELGVYDLKIGMQHWGLEFYKSGINDDLCLTLTYFTAWLKLVTCEFEWKNCYKVIKWGKLQMTKLREDLYYRKNTLLPQGVFCPCPRGYIHVYHHYFQTTVFRNRLANQAQTLCGALLERGNVNFVKMVLLT